MHNQLRVEFYKLKTSAVFYIILLFFAILGIFYGVSKLAPLGFLGNKIFLDTVGDTSLMFILTLFVSYFVGNDFNNRTIVNEIQIGHSRLSTILSKGIVALPVTALFHLVYVFSTTLTVTAINGFGTGISIQSMLIKSVLVIFQVMAIQSFAILIMFISKKSTSGTVACIGFTAITCNMLRNFLGAENLIFKSTSFYRIMMNSAPMSTNELLISFISAIVTLIVVFYATHVAFHKTEIK